jgi:pyruvate ferredoxin oxidoreductase beta subunit
MKTYYRTLRDLPREELFAPGHRMCAGCGAAIAMRWITKIVGPNAVIVNATGCVEVTTTPYPETAWMHPYIHVAFENSAAVASGVEAAIKALKRKGLWDAGDIKVVVIAGDGGTYDIGLQALSGMLERRHGVLYILYDNEAYMNTGIQRSGSTPKYAWTTTTPVGTALKGKVQWKKDIMGIVMAHRVPYAATASIAYILDMVNKIKTALEYTEEGPTFLHIFAPACPGGATPRTRPSRLPGLRWRRATSRCMNGTTAS